MKPSRHIFYLCQLRSRIHETALKARRWRTLNPDKAKALRAATKLEATMYRMAVGMVKL